ncbi:hypothetical protein SLEP1_g60346 [Rubroshorea leprosula]|uniref:Uncharacterized protein n=2 Tax=Rubroshorea leprosula TaxID=152421 RepID=A0AAV5MV10_9ROSI|nr:hypothetical protein SLEP1_g60346 [Rubroshorea leprosula]
MKRLLDVRCSNLGVRPAGLPGLPGGTGQPGLTVLDGPIVQTGLDIHPTRFSNRVTVGPVQPAGPVRF